MEDIDTILDNFDLSASMLSGPFVLQPSEARPLKKTKPKTDR